MNNLEVVCDLPFLAREINDAHRQVTFHGKSMLMEAKRAGDALIEARKKFPGKLEFGKWRAENTHIKHRNTAAQYMAVARKWADAHHDVQGEEFADMSIRAFLELGNEKAPAPEPKQAAREFTREDAERVFKLHALATRGGTPAECAAASGKLASFAATFGMTPEAVVAKAREFLPDHEKTDAERRHQEREARAAAAEQRVEELEKKIAAITRVREEAHRELSSLSREELLDLAIAERVSRRLAELGLS